MLGLLGSHGVPQLLHCKVTICSFVINEQSVGKTLGQCKYLVPLPTSIQWFQHCVWLWPESILILMGIHGGFPTPGFLLSTLRKSSPFFPIYLLITTVDSGFLTQGSVNDKPFLSSFILMFRLPLTWPARAAPVCPHFPVTCQHYFVSTSYVLTQRAVQLSQTPLYYPSPAPKPDIAPRSASLFCGA